MEFTIIGLGNYGKSLAVELTSLGHEVIGADEKASAVDGVKNSIAKAYTMDATDILSLSALPLKSMDIVIVAIGENFGASVKIVALLKQLGAKSIYARAIDDVHEAILEGFGVARILTPERDAANNLVHSIDFGTKITSFLVDGKYSILKFTVPDKFIGKDIKTLQLKEDFDITIISMTSAKKTKNFLGIDVLEHNVKNDITEDLKFEENDQLICYGTYKSFHKFWKAIH